MTNNLPKPITQDEALVRQIAMDVGKQVVAHIEWAYPDMFKVVAKTAKLSIRNATYNAVMAAVEAADKGRAEQAIEENSKHRRTMRKITKTF